MKKNWNDKKDINYKIVPCGHLGFAFKSFKNDKYQIEHLKIV